jgi:uncharacterized protein (TIGR01777 family)
MELLITGGTGFIGRALCRRLLADGHRLTVLSRWPRRVPALCGAGVSAVASLSELPRDRRFDAVINLAGEGIADRPWSAARKQLLRDSRIGVTAALCDWIAAAASPPALLISGSAVGYYGSRGDQLLDEAAPVGADFAAHLCRDWEVEAARVEALGVRLCLLRTGLVLGGDGGMLARLKLPFSLGLGGRLGDGRQWMSWIHRDDLVALIVYLLDHPTLQGPFNGTAPEPVTNADFTRALARALRRPALLPMPAFALRLALGEMAGLLLGGQRVLPQRALEAGFEFRYPTLPAALDEIFSGG